MVTEHPWKSSPAELLGHALEHLHLGTDSDRRIAFLLLDVGVETLFKTFLTSPAKATGARGEYGARKKAAEGNFHELVEGVQAAAGDRLAGFDLGHVEYYHNLRNKLYHEGDGVIPASDKAKDYARLAVGLLKALLDVDLTEELRRPEIEAETRGALETMRALAGTKLEDLRRELALLEADLMPTIECLEPKLALPSFARKARALGLHGESVFYDRQKYDQLANEIVTLVGSTVQDPKLRARLVAEEDTWTKELGQFYAPSVATVFASIGISPLRLYLRIAEIAVSPGDEEWVQRLEEAEWPFQFAGGPKGLFGDTGWDRIPAYVEKLVASLSDIRAKIRAWLGELEE